MQIPGLSCDARPRGGAVFSECESTLATSEARQKKKKKNWLHINSCYDVICCATKAKRITFFCSSLLFTQVCTYSLLAKRMEESKNTKHTRQKTFCLCNSVAVRFYSNLNLINEWTKKSGFFCIYFFPIWEEANNTRSAKRHFVLVNEMKAQSFLLQGQTSVVKCRNELLEDANVCKSKLSWNNLCVYKVAA